MTKKELKEIESFLTDMGNNGDDIEVMNRVWSWLRAKYHSGGKKKLASYNKNL